MTASNIPSPEQALAIARHLMATRFHEAEFGIAAGSLLRGEGTAHSDLDMIVVYPRLPVTRRESFLVDGLPVQAFLHDSVSLDRVVGLGAAHGRPSFPTMIVEGSVVGRAPERAQPLRRAMAALLAKGPPALAPEQMAVLRYAITEAIDDLRPDRDLAEKLAIGVMLHPRMVELALRGRGHWHANSKWVPRSLAAADAALADRFDRAFRALFATGASDAVIALAEQELAPHGGWLFDGDCQFGPPPLR